MKTNKRITAIAMTALFMISGASTAFAGTAPDSLLGTEKTYGENSTRYGELLKWEDGVDARYAIIPKNDTFSFTKGSSNVDSSHNVTVSWECPNSFDENGQVGLFWESGMTAKTDKLEFGKEYPVYPDDVKAKIMELKNTGYYNMSHTDNPFIIINVVDENLNDSWIWVLNVTDNWVLPQALKIKLSIGHIMRKVGG